MVELDTDDRLHRRTVLQTTGGILGGLAAGGALAPSVAAQSAYFRYEQVHVRLVDVDRTPPEFLIVDTPLYLTEAGLAGCDTGHPCSLDVLAYRRLVDDDTDDDDDDTDDDDDDAECPGFASVVLLCHAESAADTVVLTGLIRDVLHREAAQDFDYVVNLAPSSATNVTDPESVSNPCPSATGRADDDDDDDGDDDADDGDDDDDDGDDGDDRGDDDGDDDDGDDDDDES